MFLGGLISSSVSESPGNNLSKYKIDGLSIYRIIGKISAGRQRNSHEKCVPTIRKTQVFRIVGTRNCCSQSHFLQIHDMFLFLFFQKIPVSLNKTQNSDYFSDNLQIFLHINRFHIIVFRLETNLIIFPVESFYRCGIVQ